MKATVEKITPEMAKSYLEKNHSKQRNTSPTHALHLAQQMKAGQWMMNGEPIIMDENDGILDGQHRLIAIVHAGVAVEMMVVRGVSPDAFMTIDRGKPRSNGNIFAIAGIKNYNSAAACVSGVWNYRRALKVEIKRESQESLFGGSLNTYLRPSSQDMLDEYHRNESQYSLAVALADKTRNLINKSSGSMIAGMALLDGKMGEEWVRLFWDQFASGLDLSPTNPIYHLRERLIKNKSEKCKFSVNHAALLCGKAWNLFAREKECKALRIDTEKVFPIF